MADNEKYLIRLHGKDIEVSEDVYYAYFQMARQERTQDEKLQRNHVVSYDAMDNEGMVGAEAFEDLEAPSMEELIMAKELYERLHHAVEALPKAERELIRAIYFEGKTERECAKERGCSQNKIFKQRVKTLSKLKIFLDFMGSF